MTNYKINFRLFTLFTMNACFFTASTFAGNATDSPAPTAQSSASVAAKTVSKPISKTLPKSPSAPTSGGDFSNQLLALLLDRNTNNKLYEQGNNPWPGGAYKFEVFKDGKPTVSTGATEIRVLMPMKIAIAGDVGNALLNFKMACSTSFTTVAEVRLTPLTRGTIAPLVTQITLPIPPVSALCDGAPVPIDAYLKNLFDQNKRRVEMELDAKINIWLSEQK